MVTQFRESRFRQSEFLSLDPQIARIDHFGLNRQTLEIAAPVALFHYQPDVNFIPRPVNAAFGKNERVETFRRDVFRAFNLKAREIQDPVFAPKRHESDVFAIARDVRYRGFFALRFFNRWKSTMTIRRCFGRLDRHAVLAQNVNSGAVDRLAVLDRHQEDVAAAISIFLR